MEACEVVREQARFASEGLWLDGELAYPSQGVPATALLLLSPHPHMGGRMDNNVIRLLALRAAEAGCATLRFDYRGVGRSEIRLPPGTSRFEHFAGLEREQRYAELLPDAHAAYRHLMQAVGRPPRRIVLGYSLGAVLAGLLASQADATAVVALSPPVAKASLEAYRAVAAPKRFLAGDCDFAFDAERFRAEFEALPEPRSYVSLPGCDHFFRREEQRVFDAVADLLGDDPGGDSRARAAVS